MIPPLDAQCKHARNPAVRHALNAREMPHVTDSEAGRPRLRGRGRQGIGLAGALATLEERGFAPQNVAGTSAGAISAALLAAGCRSDELRTIVTEIDFRQFEDKAWEDRLPIAENTFSVLLDLGIYEGDYFLTWMREQLAAKGIHTFADLVREDETDERWRHSLQVIASDVTTRELLVLPRDARKLGIEPDELEVALAVRMSMSIPIFFEPVRFENPETKQEHIIVDGGMLEPPRLALRLRRRHRARVADLRAAAGRADALDIGGEGSRRPRPGTAAGRPPWSTTSRRSHTR